MGIYEYNGIRYNKRKLTNDILLKVVTDEIKLVTDKSDEYREKAELIKQGEETSQLDACPVRVNVELREIIETLRRTYEGLRARHTQTAPVLYADEISAVSDDDAGFMIANGSIAVLSKNISEEAQKKLLKHHILPIIVDDKVDVGSYVFIRNIVADILDKKAKADAYIVNGELKAIDAYLPLEIYRDGAYSEIWK